MATQDFNALVPSTVRVIFPRTLDGKVKSSVHTVDVTLASLNLSEYHPVGYTGHSGTKNIRSSCTAVFTTAGGGTPTNNTELNNLANQIAKDFYLWQLGRLDIVFDGIANYEPNAFADSIFWDYRPDKIVTRVQRKGWRDIEEEWSSSYGTGASYTKCCGNIFINGNDIYFDGDSSYSFNGNLIIDNDITNITTDTINITTTDYNLTGDSITIGGNTTVLIDIGTDSTTTLTTTIGGDTVTLGGDVITIGEETTTTIDIGTDSTVTLTTTIVGDTINIGTDSTTTTTVNIGFVNITGGNVYFYNANVYNNLTIIGTFVVTGDCTIGGAGDTITIIGDTKYGDTTTTTTAPPGRLELPFMTVTGPPTYTGTTGETITDGDNIYVYDGGWNTIGGGGGTGKEQFDSYLTEYTDWSTASTTNTVTIATYGARTHVDKVLARVKTAFGGGSISALDYTITLESTGESSASDTPAGGLTPAETAHRVSISEYCGSYTNNTVLKVTVTATGGNLDTLTAGALELWVVHRTLPIPT